MVFVSKFQHTGQVVPQLKWHSHNVEDSSVSNRLVTVSLRRYT